MIKNYFKTAVRNLGKNKGYSFLNIMGLAVGITCAGMIFLWVEDELGWDHNNAKRDILYQVYENQSYEGKTYTFAATPGPLAPGMKNELPGVKNSCRTTWGQNIMFSLNDKSIFQNGFYADSSIFSMFSFTFLQGNPYHAFDQPKSLVIS